MSLPASSLARRAAFAELRATLATAHCRAAPAAFTLAAEHVIATGLPALDTVLAGGFPRGIIATLEGPDGSGRSSVLARLLAQATQTGLGVLIESPESADGRLHPAALAAAGVHLNRLLIIHACDALGIARAADIVLRAQAFRVVALPAVALKAQAWTRLAGLAHRANALLVALGPASSELRFFASLRLEFRTECVHWAGDSGLFGTLAGAAGRVVVAKHKRAAPGGEATLTYQTFETGAPPCRLREHHLAVQQPPRRRHNIG